MLRAPKHLSMHFAPRYRLVQLLVYPAHDGHTVSPDDVEAERNLFAGFIVAAWSDDTLYGLLEDEVHAAVARVQHADHVASVEGEDRDLFCGESMLARLARRRDEEMEIKSVYVLFR